MTERKLATLLARQDKFIVQSLYDCLHKAVYGCICGQHFRDCSCTKLDLPELVTELERWLKVLK
jgi:hypothetical protein